MKTKVLLCLLFLTFITTLGLTSCEKNEDILIGGESMKWIPDLGEGYAHEISVPVEGGTFQYVCTSHSSLITEFIVNGERLNKDDLIQDVKYDDYGRPIEENTSGEWFAVASKSSSEQGVLNVTISPNDSGADRTCGVEVTSMCAISYFRFNQKGK